MSGIRIEYDDREVLAALANLTGKTQNMRTVMRTIGTALVERNRLRFNRQVGPDGNPWAPTKRGGQILRKSGVLFNSLMVGEVTDTSVEFGTNVPYAAAHQFGSKPYVIKPRLKKALYWPGATHPMRQVNHPGLKARPFLGISADDQQEVLAILAQYLAK